jgi:hypothetical protein
MVPGVTRIDKRYCRVIRIRLSDFDSKIVSVHFYHNIVFIYKGRNEEGSNLVRQHIY